MKRAFTLIEVLVVVGIIILFLGISIPSFRLFQQNVGLNNVAKELESTLLLAQSRTLASEGESQYGVFFDATASPHQYILFQGDSFATRNQPADETSLLPKTLEFSAVNFQGGSEVVFERVTGTTSLSGSLTLQQIADSSKSITILVQESGTIEQGSPPPPSDAARITDSRHVHVAYQGRVIDTNAEKLRLVFPDAIFEIDIVSNMQDGEIFWEGEAESEGEIQQLKIHTHVLNDLVLGTEFSIHRDRRENSKAIELQLSGDGTGGLIQYDGAGVITQGTSIYAGTPQLQ